MSMGYGAMANVLLEDDKTVIYEYAAYNYIEATCRNEERIYDGMIEIDKTALPKVIVTKKIKKGPNGKKRVITRYHCDKIDYVRLTDEGKIVIDNSRFCWKFTPNGVGFMAMRILFILFGTYEKEGILLKHVEGHS